MSDLFARAASAPMPAPTKAPAAERSSTWRAPGERDHVCCVCAGMAVFGDGASWFCIAHPPHGFLPSSRDAR